MSKYKHIFFDLDETLWDFKRNSLETLHDMYEEYELEKHGVEKTRFLQRYHHHNNFYWDLFRKGKITREELRIVRFKTTLREFKVHDEVLIKTLSENYLRILPTKKNLFHDTTDVLNYLQPKYALHIITNGFEEVQMKKINNTPLHTYFTHIITSERAGIQKPNSEIFLYALQVAGALVHESIFIGDSIEADINGAKAVGMDYVFYNPEKVPHTEEIETEISELTALKTFL